MGEPWMMFTKTQGRELINNTIHEWTSINGVDGRKFTSKTDSSKYIFLPAGGVWGSTTHGDVRSKGYYWSTAWGGSPESTWPWHLYFYYDSPSMSNLTTPPCGDSIRPVAPPRPW